MSGGRIGGVLAGIRLGGCSGFVHRALHSLAYGGRGYGVDCNTLLKSFRMPHVDVRLTKLARRFWVCAVQ